MFDQLKTTGEDRSRAAMYQQNRLRDDLQAHTTSFVEFMAGLELEVAITPAAAEQVARVAQLTQRTNQFNMTGLRRTERELRQLVGQNEILTVSVRDRFGDYGLVGATDARAATSNVVDQPCQAAARWGRGVEHDARAVG